MNEVVNQSTDGMADRAMRTQSNTNPDQALDGIHAGFQGGVESLNLPANDPQKTPSGSKDFNENACRCNIEPYV